MNAWNPERTSVVVVGVLEWLHPEVFSPFPAEHRRDEQLVGVVRGRGVPDGRVLYLADEEATTARIASRVPELLERTEHGDAVIVYYCGHGSRAEGGETFFASYDADGGDNSGWPVRSVLRMVDRHFHGSHALLMADCCYSGALADEVRREKGRIAYASLASSLASELSTGNWTFTEQVLGAFRGQAFSDRDASGPITLGELGDQIVETMAFAEDQMATFAVGAGFDPGLVVAPARARADPNVGRRVEARSGDSWYRGQIVDARGGRLRVHYFGYEDDEDEWVTGDMIRELARVTYAPGRHVDVKWKSDWYPATVLAMQHGIHLIGYDDFGPEWNEWVGAARIRERA
jgi:hypothetical protein